MKTITFESDREFDYGSGVVLHRAGTCVEVHEGGPGAVFADDGAVKSLRVDKAQRWVNRGVAQISAGPAAPKAPAPTEEELQALVASAAADEAARAAAQNGTADDNAVDGAPDVVGKDSGGAGKRAVDEPAGGKPGAPSKGGSRGK